MRKENNILMRKLIVILSFALMFVYLFPFVMLVGQILTGEVK